MLHLPLPKNLPPHRQKQCQLRIRSHVHSKLSLHLVGGTFVVFTVVVVVVVVVVVLVVVVVVVVQ